MSDSTFAAHERPSSTVREVTRDNARSLPSVRGGPRKPAASAAIWRRNSSMLLAVPCARPADGVGRRECIAMALEPGPMRLYRRNVMAKDWVRCPKEGAASDSLSSCSPCLHTRLPARTPDGPLARTPPCLPPPISLPANCFAVDKQL